MSDIQLVLSLAEELETMGYGVKAEALATAYEAYCEHANRVRFQAEVHAIKSCDIATFIESRRTSL